MENKQTIPSAFKVEGKVGLAHPDQDLPLHTDLKNSDNIQVDEVCIPQLFEAQVKSQPDSLALRWQDICMSYAQLNAKANQVAHFLRTQGVGQDVPVGICMERNANMVIAILAVLKAGGCYLPLDADYPQDRLIYMVEQSSCSIILSESDLLEELELLSQVVTYPLDGVYFDAFFAGQSESNLSAQSVGLWPANLAYIIYTSGSTGTPKGTAVTQKNVVSLIFNHFIDFDRNKVFLCAASPSFDAFTFELWGALLHGGCCVLVQLKQIDFQQLGNIIQQHKVDCAWLTAAVFNQVINTSPKLLGELKTLLVGGEALSKEHIQVALREMRETQLINGYGPTECTTFACTENIYQEQIAGLSSIPIGNAIGNVQLYVLDDRGERVKPGQFGELYIGGAGLSRGYLGKPAMTAEMFVPNAFAAKGSERLYRTGDRVRELSDGKIEYLGRIDSQVKIRGYRIELAEVENQLMAYSLVRQAVTLVHQNSNGDKSLIAYIEVDEGCEQDNIQRALLQHMRDQLPDYMVPSAFVLLPEMPLTVNGKLDRQALPAVDSSSFVRAGYEPPTNELEKALADLWQQNLDIKQIGVTDNYLVIGGDSIRAISLVADARKQGIQLAIKHLFSHPTIRELADVLSEQSFQRLQPNEEKIAPFALLSIKERACLQNQYSPDELQDAYPLSQVQQGMLYHFLQGKELNLYHDIVTYQVDCRYDQKRWTQALALLVRKHDILRTRFSLDSDRPLQLVLTDKVPAFSKLDLSHLPRDQQECTIRQWLEQEKQSGFDPLKSLFRLAIFVLSPEQIQVALSFHHAMWDGWSDAIFVREWVTLANQIDNNPTQLIPPPGYNYLVSQELAAMSDEKMQSYWQDKLKDVKAPWWSNADKQRSVQFECDIPKSSCSKIMALASAMQVQEKSIWGAAYIALLAMLDGHDKALGSIVTHTRPEMDRADETLGLFLNSLPLLGEIKGRSWRELIIQINHEITEQYPVRQFPLAEIQRRSGLDFSSSLFNYINFHVHGDQDDQMHIRSNLGFVETNYLFALNVRKSEDGSGYSAQVSADRGVFNQQFRTRIKAYVENIVADLSSAPERLIDRQALIGEKELGRLRFEWNHRYQSDEKDKVQPTTGSNSNALTAELVESQVVKSPYAIALVDGQRHLSFAELNRRANRLASHLVDLHIGPETRVGICMPRSLEMGISLLGVVKSGAAYVPLNPADPIERLDYIIRDAAINLLLVYEDLKTLFENTPLGNVQLLCMDEFERYAPSKEYPNISAQHLGLSGSNLAYIIYTSGTSGTPKGVMVEHQGLAKHCRATTEMRGFDSSTRNLQFAPIMFDAATAEFLNAFISGSLLHLPAQHLLANHNEFERYVRMHRINRGYIPPAFLTLLDKNNFKQYVSMSVGGESVARETLKQWSAICPITNAYGPTECTITATTGVCDGRSKVSIGRPLSYAQAYVVDQNMCLLPTGVAGELYVGGQGVSRGYLNNPALTADKFVPDPFSQQAGVCLYKTGDRVRWLDDGTLEFIGRMDQQVKLRGHRIELEEIERRLASHPEVRDTAVVVQQQGSDQAVIIAFAVPAKGDTQNEQWTARLKVYLQQHLPAYMVPARIGSMETLPLTPNGKVDRERLQAIKVEVPSSGDFPSQGMIEELLSDLWCDLLKLDSVGRYDNFFDVGGHSLLATQLISRIRSTFDLELSIRVLFEGPSIAELATAIERGLGNSANESKRPPLVANVRSEQSLSLSFAQQRLWFLSQLTGPDATYNIPLALRLSGSLDVAVLGRCINTLFERHQALRTRFIDVGGQPQIIIQPYDLIEFNAEWVSGAEQIADICRQEQQHLFNLANESLIHIRLLKESDTSHVLLITMHHIVSDGWSLALLFKEMTALYEAYSGNRQSPLDTLTVEYTDYADWQRQWLSGEVMGAQLTYWRKQLAGLPPLLQLPSDRPRPVQQSFKGGTCAFKLSSVLATQLGELSKQHGVTMFTTLFSAFSLLLQRYAQQDDFAIGVPVANRTMRETEQLVGFFVNTLVLRCDLSAFPTFAQLLKRTRSTALEAFAHQDVPFEQLVHELNPVRSLSHSPLFQVMFSLQNTQMEPVVLPGLDVNSVQLHEFGVSRFDLTLYMTETADGIDGNMEFNSDLFDRQSVEHMLEQFQTLLDAVAADPHKHLPEYELTSQAETQALEQYRCPQPLEKIQSLQNSFTQLAMCHPDATALEHEGLGLSFSQVEWHANQLASQLKETGTVDIGTIGIALECPLSRAVAILAVLKSGAGYYLLPSNLPMFRRQYLLEQADLGLLLVDADRSLTEQSLCACMSLEMKWTQAELAQQIEFHESNCEPQASACISYTQNTWLTLSHTNIQCVGSASSAQAFRLWGLDIFSCNLWWHWLNGRSCDLTHAASWAEDEDYRLGQSIPLPTPGSQIQVLSDGQCTQVGGVGELCLGGQALATPLKGVSATIKDHWLHTGILVRTKYDGSISYWGSLAEKQAQQCQTDEVDRLCRLLKDDITNEDVAVVVRQGNSEQDTRLCVYIGRSEAVQQDILADVVAYITRQSRTYLLPNSALLLPHLPRSSDGSIDITRLPTLEGDMAVQAFQPPQGDVETLLAGIWCQVLQIEHVGRQHNFFDLGGYSLLVTQVASRINDTFGVAIPVKALFEQQTIQAQAQLIDQWDKKDSVLLGKITPLPKGTQLPMSFAQQRLWFLWQLMGPSAVYNIPLVLRLKGELDVLVLERSLDTILARHDVLRSRFVSHKDDALQRVEPHVRFSLELEVLENAQQQESICKSEREYAFDLANESLCRIRLLKMAEQEHFLLITLHHIVTDGWSTDILFKELKSLYDAYRNGEDSPLVSLSVQYADYAHWQRQAFTEQLQVRQIDYWTKQLQGMPPLLELPTDFVRPAEQSYRGSVHKLELDSELSTQLRDLSRAQGATLFMTLLSAFSILLSRYARQTDIAIGTPSVNRSRQETEELIGFFLNSLVIRCDLSQDVAFKDYIKQVRETTLQAYSHQDLPFEHLVETLNPERSLSHSPLFQVSFSLVNNPVTSQSIEGLDMSFVMPDEGDEGVARYDITFNLADREDGIVGAMEYNTDLFKASTIKRMQSQYIQLLRAIVASPDARLSEYDLLDTEEKNLLLYQCNDTQRDYPHSLCVNQIFELQVEKTPQAVAAIYHQQYITYAQLNHRANQVAHYLRRHGVGPEVCVGLCVERSLDMLVGFLAILKAGGCYVVLDPEYPESRLEYMLQQSRCQLVLSESALMTEWEWLTELQTLPLDEKLHQAVFGYMPDTNVTVDESGLSPLNRAYVIYTSGSTGQPKGVVITHDNITSLVCSGSAVQQCCEDVVVQASNHSFDAITYEMWGALLNGAKLLMIDKPTLLQPQLLADILSEQEASILFITTAMFNRINQDVPHAFNGLQKLLFGGEAFSAQAIETALTVGCPAQLHHVYGPTECTTYATNQLLSKEAFMDDKKAPIGLPLANNTAYVVNQYQLAPVGTIGELWLGGQGLSRGYLEVAGLTAEKFVPNPFSHGSGERLYRTGDLVRQLADGSIDFVGRVDHQVKIRGFRIELGEVEAALGKHPDVKDCIVVVRQSSAEDRHLVAYLVAKDPQADVDQLKLDIITHLQKSMPDYVVPRALMLMDKLPLNQNGKVDRSKLPEPQESAFARVCYVPPANQTETTLVEVWQNVIGLEQIGVEDNFFAIGGDSIRSISVVAECKARGLFLAVKDLFSNPTIAALAKIVSEVKEQHTSNENLEAFALLSAEESDSLMQDIAAEDF